MTTFWIWSSMVACLALALYHHRQWAGRHSPETAATAKPWLLYGLYILAIVAVSATIYTACMHHLPSYLSQLMALLCLGLDAMITLAYRKRLNQQPTAAQPHWSEEDLPQTSLAIRFGIYRLFTSYMAVAYLLAAGYMATNLCTFHAHS